MIQGIEQLPKLSDLDTRKAKETFIKSLEDSHTIFTAGGDGIYQAYCKGTVVRLATNYENGTVLADSSLGVKLREETLIISKAFVTYASTFKFKRCDLYTQPDEFGMSASSQNWIAGETVHFRIVAPISEHLDPDKLVGIASISARKIASSLEAVVQGFDYISHCQSPNAEAAAHRELIEALLASIEEDD